MVIRSMALLVVLLMLVALFVGGAQPIAVGLFSAPWDKVAHATFFFVFSLLLTRLVGLPMALVVTLALIVGALDEMHQYFLPGRDPGLDDWVADAIGTCLGILRFRRYSSETLSK